MDQSSFMPTLVAMSSAEAEYNTAYTACMSAAHHRMLHNEFRLLDPDESSFPVIVLLDSQSTKAMGSSFRDSKHTRHIERRFHYVHHRTKDLKHALHWLDADLQLVDIETNNIDSTELQPRLRIIIVEVSR